MSSVPQRGSVGSAFPNQRTRVVRDVYPTLPRFGTDIDVQRSGNHWVMRSGCTSKLNPCLAARAALPIYFAAVFNLYRKRLAGVLESDLLEPYERLIKIEVLGHMVEVPEKNRLLRCFQFLSLNTISYGDFCWNGECTNCQFWYHEAGQDENQDKTGLSCRFDVVEDMIVTRLSPHVEIEGINLRSHEDAG